MKLELCRAQTPHAVATVAYVASLSGYDATLCNDPFQH